MISVLDKFITITTDLKISRDFVPPRESMDEKTVAQIKNLLEIASPRDIISPLKIPAN